MKFVEAGGMRLPAVGLGTWELRGRDCVRLVQDAVSCFGCLARQADNAETGNLSEN